VSSLGTGHCVVGGMDFVFRVLRGANLDGAAQLELLFDQVILLLSQSLCIRILTIEWLFAKQWQFSSITKVGELYDGAVGRGKALHAVRSRVRFSMVCLEFFIE
jgi:hypothetical protein